MRKSSMANVKPPECNSISTTAVAVIDITKGGFNGVKLVRKTSIPLYLLATGHQFILHHILCAEPVISAAQPAASSTLQLVIS